MDQVKTMPIHPHDKLELDQRRKRHLADDRELRGEEPTKELCSRAINRLKSRQPNINEAIKYSKLEREWAYKDKTFEFAESIHWENLPGIDYQMDGDIDKISWKRINDAFNVDDFTMWGDKGIEPKDAIQGQMGNCWLITAAISMAQNVNRIRDMFTIQQRNSASIYAAKMYLLDMPITVVVDDYIPLLKRDEDLTLYAKVSADGGLWGTLYEKFFAKFFGNYETIDAGGGGHGIQVATGSPAKQF
jgi:hypothetical protein